ncbi:MAG: PHP domain-containing protein, partial [Bacteroidia bacterium]|nr:PHP domain-containing protein [Bacteroidia bacterium]
MKGEKMGNKYFNGHSHTDMSNVRLLDSTVKVNELIDKAIEIGLGGIAITDHEILANHVKAQKHLKKLRKEAKTDEMKEKVDLFRLVLGNEIYLTREGVSRTNYNKGKDRYWHFILLAKDKIGHEQLRQLSSLAWKRSYRQYIERVPTYPSDIEAIIGANKGHIVASTACLGSQFANLVVAAQRNQEKKDELNEFVDWCLDIFGEDFYIEIQPSEQQDQILYNTLAIAYAHKRKIKVTITTDIHYLTIEDRKIHKAFLNAKDGDREVDSFYSATYLMSWEEICRYMSYIPEKELEEIRENTLDIMFKCEEYSLESKQVVPRTDVKEVELIECPPSKYTYINKFCNSSHQDDKIFISHVLNKLHEISIGKDSDWKQKHLERLEIELEEVWLVSERLGDRLSAYFTTMMKIINIAWEKSESIVGPGRGSSYVMLICYLLGITQADPLNSPVELPHWRFLHREKLELPDIDTDFQASKKDRIINDITEFFESLGGNVVRIATFGTETSKAAIQTATRGLGYEPELGTYLSSLVPVDRGQVRDLKSCFYGNEEKEQDPSPGFRSEMSSYQDIWKVALGIEGLISRRGVHAAGILITNDDFTKRNAFMKAPNGVLTSQFELHDSEEMGGLKYDLLVTQALDKIAVTLNLLKIYGYIDWKGSIRETYNHYLSPDVLNYESKEMWDMASDGKILSLFQFDTAIGGSTIKAIRPTSLLELGQANSL